MRSCTSSLPVPIKPFDMKGRKLINILAALVAIGGLSWQIYSDRQSDSESQLGLFLVLLALMASIVNQAINANQRSGDQNR
jgi:hypothetical protein